MPGGDPGQSGEQLGGGPQGGCHIPIISWFHAWPLHPHLRPGPDLSPCCRPPPLPAPPPPLHASHLRALVGASERVIPDLRWPLQCGSARAGTDQPDDQVYDPSDGELTLADAAQTPPPRAPPKASRCSATLKLTCGCTPPQSGFRTCKDPRPADGMSCGLGSHADVADGQAEPPAPCRQGHTTPGGPALSAWTDLAWRHEQTAIQPTGMMLWPGATTHHSCLHMNAKCLQGWTPPPPCLTWEDEHSQQKPWLSTTRVPACGREGHRPTGAATQPPPTTAPLQAMRARL